jgi:hypothetical protein
LLLPPSLHDWLPEKHLARFFVDVVETLDLSLIYASYEAKDGRGQAAYAPEMMLRLSRCSSWPIPAAATAPTDGPGKPRSKHSYPTPSLWT